MDGARKQMANNNDNSRDESQALCVVYKITHALDMFVEFDPLYNWYSMKSLCSDESIDKSRLVELYGDCHLRLNIFMSIDRLLYCLLHSETIFIPLKKCLDAGLYTRAIDNPFYGLSEEEAAIKADLYGVGL